MDYSNGVPEKCEHLRWLGPNRLLSHAPLPYHPLCLSFAQNWRVFFTSSSIVFFSPVEASSKLPFSTYHLLSTMQTIPDKLGWELRALLATSSFPPLCLCSVDLCTYSACFPFHLPKLYSLSVHSSSGIFLFIKFSRPPWPSPNVLMVPPLLCEYEPASPGTANKSRSSGPVQTPHWKLHINKIPWDRGT